jgi:hypothetical protein
MRLLAEFGMQVTRQMFALEVVRECNACLAYLGKFMAALREDMALVLRVPDQVFFGWWNGGFSCHGAWFLIK